MVVALIALIVAVGGVATAAIPGSNGVVKACYSKSTGSLRVIDSGKSCSRKREKTLSINQKGPAGSPGPQGIQGIQGIQGLRGFDGPAGSARGYGRVASTGAPSRAKNASARRASQGIFCITVPGASPADTPMLVSPDFNTSGTTYGWLQLVDAPDILQIASVGGGDHLFPVIQARSNNPNCTGSEFEVDTFTYWGSSGDDRLKFDLSDEPFNFMVP
jgi:hypothetical protein